MITISKAFIRPQLDYGDVIFDQAFNNSFNQGLESIQYNAALVITAAIEELLRKNFIRNLVLSPCNPEDGFKNYLSFSK